MSSRTDLSMLLRRVPPPTLTDGNGPIERVTVWGFGFASTVTVREAWALWPWPSFTVTVTVTLVPAGRQPGSRVTLAPSPTVRPAEVVHA
jgi:hypothetical protein